ncbi:MAG: hypothetical protein WAU60_12380 [Candidatus Competibacter denitrificans]|jgi:predicted deacylase
MPIESATVLCGNKNLFYHDIGPRERTPRLALVGDLRGTGLNGMFVLSRLAAFLSGIHSGQVPGSRLRERVVIVPVTNILELPATRIAKRPRTHVDQRRSLWGATTEALVALTRTAYYRVEIQQNSPDIEDMPQVCLYAPSDDERATACLFGLPAVIERPMEPGAGSDLRRAWRLLGGENFSVHIGQAGTLCTSYCEDLFKALVSFLDRTGIVDGLNLTDEEDRLRYFDLRQVFVVLAEQSGIFSCSVTVGRWVRAGAELGRIYDCFTGGGRARMVAPVTGLVASLRRQPLLCKGELLARILVPTGASSRGRLTPVGKAAWPMGQT